MLASSTPLLVVRALNTIETMRLDRLFRTRWLREGADKTEDENDQDLAETMK